MLKVNLVAIGTIKERYFTEAIDEYKKRLSRFCSLRIVELKEARGEVDKVIEEESAALLNEARGYVIALDVDGKKLSSIQLAEKIGQLSSEGKEITLLIGGSNGMTEEAKQKANLRLSFSDMTFPHQLMRVILLEQVYRAFMINSGSTYHK